MNDIFAPALANNSATAFPIQLSAPVMSTVLPDNCNLSIKYIFGVISFKRYYCSFFFSNSSLKQLKINSV